MSKKTKWVDPYDHKEHHRISFDRWELTGIHKCRVCKGRNGHDGLFQYDNKQGKFCSKEHFNIYYRGY